ncbi:MAG: N-acetylneuraminate synthase [Candidatus Marinimicrobia bacterium]|nr:N-acetylneuraminate synthase [Candidatus Neomarinimicrobiota bacterium]|tara:strand:+ start:1118 stop:1978 length:861 start_codon:yes stop_codon:yes gene_type:complete
MSEFFKKINLMTEPYLIAEIGINHNGNMDIAKKLIDATNACGWHCAKFQKRNPDVCVPDHQKRIERDTPWGKMTYLDYKHKIEFEKNEFDIINKYCIDKSLDWTASVWDLDSLEFLRDYEIPFIKIPSAHITNNELMIEVSKSGIPIIISTGMSDWKIIDEAVNTIKKHTSDFAILHCNSTYPAPHNELNMRVIPLMKERYDCVIGYSGHEYDLEPTILSVAMGASIVERHITLDHNMWGTDQKSSLEVNGMALLQKRLKDVNLILGSEKKVITESEKPIMKKLRG